MANELDELDESTINDQGRAVHVIEKQIKVTMEKQDKVFNIGIWFFGLIIGGTIFQFKKASARNYLRQLQQKIQHDASTIDNYLQKRVTILQNTAKLLDKSIALDKETFSQIAALRSGNGGALTDEQRNNLQSNLEVAERNINVAFEAYPDLKAHNDIAQAMQQNAYLQQEITAAREMYNDTVQRWNTEIYSWPTNKIVAAQMGLTTRIPFTASKEIKERAEKEVFF